MAGLSCLEVLMANWRLPIIDNRVKLPGQIAESASVKHCFVGCVGRDANGP